MSMEGNQGTPQDWEHAENSMSDSQGRASWQREIEMRNISPEGQELLHATELKLEEGESKYFEDGSQTWPITMTGTAEGHDIKLVRQVGPMMRSSFPAASRGNMTGVPEARTNATYSATDVYSGEVDGKPIDASEAETLWKKYARTADVATTDQELSDYSDPTK